MAGAEYAKYLQSRHWQAFRLKALKHYGKKCHLCGIKEVPYFHVHHLTYERLGKEKLSDVVVLCEECHNEVHRTGFVIKPHLMKEEKKDFIERRDWSKRKPRGRKRGGPSVLQCHKEWLAKQESKGKELLKWFSESVSDEFIKNNNLVVAAPIKSKPTKKKKKKSKSKSSKVVTYKLTEEELEKYKGDTQ
ncbi:MAG: HNH endonuclease [Bacteroidales bacterium]|nr:HNH endonuclease [Bacteroidales bacterium]